MGLTVEKYAQRGLLAPSNNRIVFNPRYIKENLPESTLHVPSHLDPSQEIIPKLAKHITRHESKHLAQDVRGLLSPDGTAGPNYLIHPDEVEARIFEKSFPLNLDSIALELADAKQKTMMDLVRNHSISTADFNARKKEIADAIMGSFGELKKRVGNTSSEDPQNLLNFIMRGLR